MELRKIRTETLETMSGILHNDLRSMPGGYERKELKPVLDALVKIEAELIDRIIEKSRNKE